MKSFVSFMLIYLNFYVCTEILGGAELVSNTAELFPPQEPCPSQYSYKHSVAALLLLHGQEVSVW